MGGEGRTTVTVGWLADRLGTSPAVVRDIIGYAVSVRLFEPVEPPDAADVEVALVVRSREPRRETPPPPMPKPATMPRRHVRPGRPRPAATCGSSSGSPPGRRRRTGIGRHRHRRRPVHRRARAWSGTAAS
ncbi:hypothetical protein Prum_077450 [Phytohabitans rumicis]|uniref:Uncharacterized protein n=1 Tax=Phytohabitans rumicis TaxID=1076125 RepID=A0A6V8LA72_9ACTN|nr:hypothetical protein Prum_077450 [Phytohabitans rumicis]